jgi:hypothetical protein
MNEKADRRGIGGPEMSEICPSASLAEMARAHQKHPRRETVYPDHTPAPESPEVIHIVMGFRESVIVFLSRLAPRLFPFAPRALCGVVMWGDPDRPDPMPYPQTPFCPACVAIDGRDPDTIAAHGEHVPGYWI